MNTYCFHWLGLVCSRYWELTDPAGGDLEGIRPIRDAIRDLIVNLIDELFPTVSE